jgi:hypothetical protein
MAHVLRIEAIGAGKWPRGPVALLGKSPSTGWCARVSVDCGQVEREFLRPMVDYAKANGAGSRGVYKTYILRDGAYEVFEKTSWASSRRYFLAVSGKHAEELSDARAVEDWLERWQS